MQKFTIWCFVFIVGKSDITCPEGYLLYSRNCYAFKKQPMTWDEARASCKKDDTRSELVSVHNSYESGMLLRYTFYLISNSSISKQRCKKYFSFWEPGIFSISEIWVAVFSRSLGLPIKYPVYLDWEARCYQFLELKNQWNIYHFCSSLCIQSRCWIYLQNLDWAPSTC